MKKRVIEMNETPINRTEGNRINGNRTGRNKTEEGLFSLEQLKIFISDWTARIPKNKMHDETPNPDENLKIGSFPLSWFYRPILYSSLLPPPFPTINDIYNNKKINTKKIKITSSALKKYLMLNDAIKKHIAKKKEKKELDDKKILFLTFTNHLSKIESGTSVFRIQNIIEKIKSDKKYTPLILLIDPISRFSPSKIYGCENTIYSYYDNEIEKKSHDDAAMLFSQWKSISEEQKQASLERKEKKYYPLLKQNIDLLYSKEMLYLVSKWYHTFQKILSAENIESIILTSQNNIFEKCVIAAAQKQNTPVLIIQHGIGLGTLPTINTPNNVKFAVFGEKYKKELINQHIPKKNIKITGPTIFDEIEKYTSQNQTKLEKTKKTLEQKTTQEILSQKTILLATSPFIEDRFLTKEQYFKRVRLIINQLATITKNINLKLHPRERNIEEYQKIINEYNLNSTLSNNTDRNNHYQLIIDADITITFGSTVALEAMILQKPTITIDLFDEYNPTNKLIINSGATIVIKYNESASNATETLLLKNRKEKQAKQFIKELCHKIDGKASQRTVQYIYKEIETNNKKREA